MITTDVIQCDSCKKKKKNSFSFISNLGWDVGEEWVTHIYSPFVQCKSCFKETDKLYKQAESKTSWLKRFFNQQPDWYTFAKGHRMYKTWD